MAPPSLQGCFLLCEFQALYPTQELYFLAILVGVRKLSIFSWLSAPWPKPRVCLSCRVSDLSCPCPVSRDGLGGVRAVPWNVQANSAWAQLSSPVEEWESFLKGVVFSAQRERAGLGNWIKPWIKPRPTFAVLYMRILLLSTLQCTAKYSQMQVSCCLGSRGDAALCSPSWAVHYWGSILQVVIKKKKQKPSWGFHVRAAMPAPHLS